MSNFASFRKCDFQVHSCRDPNWQGQRPIGLGDPMPDGKTATEADVEAARRAWAEVLVDTCIARGIRALALTDHHEMVMAKYAIEEVKQRVAAGNDPDLWIFPGMELTLQGGCQCIVLFDCDLEPQWWIQAKGNLGINHAGIDMHASKGASVTQLGYPYVDIWTKLDPIPQLCGRYIVLPNVSEGGQYSVVTNAEHKNFREMPYVGGYLDKGQTIDTLGNRQRKRLSGEDKTWGNRFIYPLPTSDSREAGYPRLGSNDTWIKTSDRTAESIRQAFLGWKSRIAVTAPTYAAVVIRSVTIKGTNPLGDTHLDFSPEFNAVIGGRGSGKSTLLECMAFGLGRSCYDLTDKQYSGLIRLSSLIKDTVIAEGGEVIFTVSQDGADFEIVRSATTGFQPLVKYPNDKKEMLTPKDVRSLFPAFAYSQGELSELGREGRDETSVNDLLTFARAPFKAEADEADRAIATAKNGMGKVVRDFTQLWTLSADKTKAENRLAAAAARITALQATLPKLQEADQATLDKNQSVVDFGQQAERQKTDFEEVEDLVDELSSRLAGVQKLSTTLIDEPVKDAAATADTMMTRLGAQIATLKAETAAVRKALTPAYDKVKNFVAEHQKAHEPIVGKIGAQKTVAKQIAELQRAVAIEKDKIAQLTKQIAALGDLNKQFRTARADLKRSMENQTTGLTKFAQRIEELSDGSISVAIAEEGDLSDIYSALTLLAVRTRSQDIVRSRKFSEQIASDGLWKTLDKLTTEVGALLSWKTGADGDDKKKGRPDFGTAAAILGDSDAITKSFAEYVDEARYLSIAQATPKPQVTFKYKAEAKEIAFEKASEGQRAAVLLSMLLKQGGGSLIIDQPESDLDNSVITKVVDLLHAMKHKRQLLFSTHNANLVVNGAAEFVAFMCNNDVGQRVVEHRGSIDQTEVRLAITETMEGGEKAFKERQRKYGF
jgi:chromosome segregation protein